jgi:flagellar M-ring protein FliF
MSLLGVAGADGTISLAGDGTSDDDRIDIARIQGSLNANAMKQVSQMVADNPEQTVSVIRSWLQEGK